MSKLTKSLLSFLALVLTIVTVTPPAQALATTGEPSQEEINSLANDLEFIMEEAAIYDELGNVINFYFELLENQYGKLPEFEMLKEQIAVDSNQQINNTPIALAASNKTWKGCMTQAIKDHFGVAIIEAAKLLLKIGIGGNIIGATAFLTYYSASCLSGTGPWADNTNAKKQLDNNYIKKSTVTFA